MNETVNKFLLTGDKLTPGLHLRQSRFTYSACGIFAKIYVNIKKFKERGDLKYIYKYIR